MASIIAAVEKGGKQFPVCKAAIPPTLLNVQILDTKARALDSFIPQPRQGPERKAEFAASPAVREMHKIVAKLSESEYEYNGYWMYDNVCVKAAQSFRYTAHDITEFALQLAPCVESFSDHMLYATGLFITALVNESKENDFTLHLEHLSRPLPNIGYRNRKNLTVYGNLGQWAFHHQESGAGIVHGNCDHGFCGCKQGGLTVINGDALNPAGDTIGGQTIINGNAIGYLARDSTGGTISVNGNIEDMAEFKCRKSWFGLKREGATIYQYRGLIVDRGETVGEVQNR